MQSTLHVGIIMDGNGRWAERARPAAHRRPPRRRGGGPAAWWKPRRGRASASSRCSPFPRTTGGARARRWTPSCACWPATWSSEAGRAAWQDGVRLEVIGRRDRLDAGLARRHRPRRSAPPPAATRSVAAHRRRLLRPRRHPGRRPRPRGSFRPRFPRRTPWARRSTC